ncbi:nitroreductase [Actinoplanes sp. TBRC 11911]|uniref:Acg family FMN-binding oxidoreductase n=1 Tax=Actinoplanes sp. TBRC 11911 TaxID=2729386 RepID=UPI00145D3238|nr:nitroreductase [Actinoplanes sp. TBRC 11911]NMO57274.1 nitroreductase [Actinoplanes sp. TBRC 11911]
MTAEPSAALGQAAIVAGRAPSLHNSQPWHWTVGKDSLELRLDPRRVLRATDPQARLAILSCGAALHHARLQLAADGWSADVIRTPGDPLLLARLQLRGRTSTDNEAARLLRQIPRRHTDRRGHPGAPIDLHRVQSICRAVRGEGADLTKLLPRQLFVLAEAAEKAQEVEAADPEWQVEVAAWVGGDRPSRTGVPATALPADPYLLTAPVRTLRGAGTVLIEQSYQHSAVFAVLHTVDDDGVDWLRAGEALSAGWLTATALDVAVLPLSVVTEVAGSRDRISGLLNWSGYPHLVLRLAMEMAGEVPPATPRLRPIEFITYA